MLNLANRECGSGRVPCWLWFALSTAVLLPAAGAADWPEWLGPTRDSVSIEKDLLKQWPTAGPPQRFVKSIGEGYSGISVAYGHLVLFHRVRDEMVLESLDPVTGAGRWRYAYPTDYEDRYGYNGGPRAQPILHRDATRSWVFALCSGGVLTAVDLEKGQKIWSRDLQGEHQLQPCFFGVGAAPLLDGDRLFVNLGGTDPGTGLSLALAKSTGETLWKSPTAGGAYAAPRVAELEGARQLFIFHRGGLTCFDPATGSERWQYPWQARVHESVNAATPLVVGDTLFFSATYGTGSVCLRVKKSSYETLWKDELTQREKALDTHWSTANYLDGHLYGFSGRHENGSDLRCVELKTGKVLWKWASYLGRGSMLYADGLFIALGERGDLALLKLSPAGHTELARLSHVLSYPAWTPPTLANGRLYLRDEKRLICLDLRLQ